MASHSRNMGRIPHATGLSRRAEVRVPSKAAFGAQAVKLVTQVGTSNARTFKVKR